jgi:hypothetical protein
MLLALAYKIFWRKKALLPDFDFRTKPKSMLPKSEGNSKDQITSPVYGE